MGQNLQQALNWGTQWQLTNLQAGAYTVSSSTVTNGTDTYQANNINATVVAQQTAQVTVQYTKTGPTPGSVSHGTWAYDETYGSG